MTMNEVMRSICAVRNIRGKKFREKMYIRFTAEMGYFKNKSGKMDDLLRFCDAFGYEVVVRRKNKRADEQEYLVTRKEEDVLKDEMKRERYEREILLLGEDEEEENE